jgi:PAP2 superfamily
MTATAASSLPLRRTGRLRGWLSVRHPLPIEAGVVLVLYGLYELGRGLVVADPAEAHRHAHQIVALERWPHFFVEADVQRAADAVPGVIDVLSVSYLPLHLAVTTGVLIWLHQRRPAAFPFVRTAFLLASGFALVGYVVYPTAPPRLAGVGILDTVSSHIDLNGGLVSALYNPYAAVPSVHIAYALIVAVSLLRYGRGPVVRGLALVYPPAVLLIVVATGNHFFFDAAAGALDAALAVAVAALLVRRVAATRPSVLPMRLAALPALDSRKPGAPPSGGGAKRLRCGSWANHDANAHLASAGSSMVMHQSDASQHACDESRAAGESYQLGRCGATAA